MNNRKRYVYLKGIEKDGEHTHNKRLGRRGKLSLNARRNMQLWMKRKYNCTSFQIEFSYY
jgi:hypothetical protein